MVSITVYLTPALTGVIGEMWIKYVVNGTEYWYYLLDIPLSVNGIIGPFGYTDGAPYNIHQIRFPEQTINGTTYEATQTSGFMITQDWTFNVTLTPKAEPTIPTTLTIDAPATVEPGEIFTIITTLTTEAGEPLAGMETILTVPEIPEIIIRAYTGTDGVCEFMLSLPQGTYTLRATFAGTTTLGASTVTSRLSTGALDLTALAPVAAIGLLAYFVSKK